LGEFAVNGKNPETILIVEDDDSLRVLLRLALENRGYGVAEAGDRLQAMNELSLNPDIPVVILDLGLPPNEHDVIEGVTLLRAVQELSHAPKIIVLTGQDEESAALAVIREGAFDFLSKPVASVDILNAVGRALLFVRKEREMIGEGEARLQFSARFDEGLRGAREDAEERLVRLVLRETDFNVYQSAKRLGIKRESIYYFMKKFGIDRHD
jgi:two-component system, response regulator RegA